MPVCAICFISSVIKGDIEHIKQFLTAARIPKYVLLPKASLFPETSHTEMGKQMFEVENAVRRELSQIAYVLPPSRCEHKQEPFDDKDFFHHNDTSAIIPVYRFCLLSCLLENILLRMELDPFDRIVYFMPYSQTKYFLVGGTKVVYGRPGIIPVLQTKLNGVNGNIRKIMVRVHSELKGENDMASLIEEIMHCPYEVDYKSLIKLVKCGFDANHWAILSRMSKFDDIEDPKEVMKFLRKLIEHGYMRFQHRNASYMEGMIYNSIRYYLRNYPRHKEHFQHAVELGQLIDSLGYSNQMGNNRSFVRETLWIKSKPIKQGVLPPELLVLHECYVTRTTANPLSLSELARISIRLAVGGTNFQERVNHLPLPTKFKRYLIGLPGMQRVYKQLCV